MRLADVVAARLVAGLPPSAGVVVVRAGSATIVAAEPEAMVVASGPAALDALGRLEPGWWAGLLAFELGHTVETVEPRGASREPAVVPDVVLARFEVRAVVAPDGRLSLDGRGPGRALLERALRDPAPPPEPPALGPWESNVDRDGYEARVQAVLELIRAGDCYQVNLTRRLTCAREADPVALYGALARDHPAPYAALLRLEAAGGALGVVSASPERFLRWQGRQVETKPIKGTASQAATLRSSAKDHAENVMIVDLARNDLGRVCRPGSVEVPALCAVESHPGLHHLVSTVRGTLVDGVSVGELVRATFPPASVTGAPKPRVLQAIEDLEPGRRGAYCGGLGWIDTERGAGDLAVAIRTFTVRDGCTTLGVGGGVVADSDPRHEWEETELKAARLLEVAGSHAPALVPA